MFGSDHDDHSQGAPLADPPLPNIPEWDVGERLRQERELTGFYITGHPLTRYEAVIQKFSTGTCQNLSESSDGREVRLCGIVKTVKAMTTKKGDRMAYFTIEDLHGMIEVIAFPDLYRSAGTLIVSESLIRVTGTIDRAEKGTRLKGTKVESLSELQTRGITRVNLRFADAAELPGRLIQLQQVLSRHPGHATISITFCLPNLEADTALLPNLTILPSEGFVAEVEDVLGKGAVALL